MSLFFMITGRMVSTRFKLVLESILLYPLTG
jgi:hypothetical protein